MQMTPIAPIKLLENQGVMQVNEENNKVSTVDDTADSFATILQNAINDVQKLDNESTKLTEDLVLDRTTDLHKVMIASEKANIALQFMVKVRDKAIDAYQEIMRMQV